MIYGKVRIVKTNDIGEIIFDEKVDATFDNNQVILTKPINCNTSESLYIYKFEEDKSVSVMIEADQKFQEYINKYIER